MLDNPGSEWKNNYLIYLNVKDEIELGEWIDKLTSLGVRYSVFREPDLGHQKTAIAAVNSNGLFKDLKLLR